MNVRNERMHYYALAVIPAEGDVDLLVGETLAPYSEDLEVERATSSDGESYMHNPVGLWDWYQIGGRWTGRLSNYEPDKDPNLLETCLICGGSGMRNDTLGQEARAQNPDYTCNGCAGKGKRVSWPSSWPKHEGDVVDLSDANLAEWVGALGDSQVPYAILTHGAEACTLKEKWDGKNWVDVHDAAGMRVMLLATLESRAKAGLSNRVAIVDYHA